MGMFDYFQIRDPEVQARVRCCNDHPASENQEFQTKDHDCSMHTLYVEDGRLHVIDGGWMVDEGLPPPPEDGDPLEYTGQIRFYGTCRQCPETYWLPKNPERRTVLGRLWLQRSRPWTEYVALFHRGKLVAVEPVKIETVEEDSEAMRRYHIQTDAEGNPL